MVQPNQYSIDFLSSCKTIENEKIDLKPNLSMKTQIGIIDCIKTLNEPRMDLLLNIAELPCSSNTKSISLCTNKVVLYYTPIQNFNVDIIVIPNSIIRIWNQYTSHNNYVLKILNHLDLSRMSEIDKKNWIAIVSDRVIEKALSIFVEMGYNIRKLILDSCDDLNLPKKLQVNYQFLWIVSFGFLNDVLLLKNRKSGFIKDVINDLSCEYMKNIYHKITIHIDDPSVAYEEEIIKSNHCSYTNITDALKDNDISHAVCMINPLIFYKKEFAYNHILNHVKSTIHHIDSHMHVINEENTDRILGLTEKRIKYENIYNSSITRLDDSQTCNICIDQIENKTILKCCNNSFCFRCINTWLQIKTRCPICKSRLNHSSDQVLIPNIELNIGTEILSSNSVYQNFIILVNKLQNESLLIHYESTFILNLLKTHNISFHHLRKQQAEKRKTNISVITNPIVGCGRDYKFDHFITIIDHKKQNYGKFINIYKPKKVWYIQNNMDE